MEPAIELLGVYRVRGFDSELRQSVHDFYLAGHAYSDTSASVLDYIGRCIPLLLFDVVVSGTDERFRFDYFTQEMEQAPNKAWQVAYDEALLDVDGCRVLARGLECGRGLHFGRAAFYFHYSDPQRPMQWIYGSFRCPEVQPISAKLAALLPYREVGS